MKTRKTRSDQRNTYTYEFSSNVGNQSCRIIPDFGEVTDMHVKKLHALDDSEVYYNNKQLQKRTKEETAEWEDYNKLHHCAQSSRAPFSLDYGYEDGIHQEYLDVVAQTACYNPYQTDREYRVHELINDLPQRQREILMLCHFEGYNQTEISRQLGLSKSTVNEHLRKAEKYIRENFYKNFPA